MSAAPFPRGGPLASREFTINTFTRTLDDSCEVAQQFQDQLGPGIYQTTNLVPKQAAATAVEYPNPTLLGKEGYGFNNGSIDDDSALRANPTLEGRQRCPLHVQGRPFATVPYMGNGRGNPDVESGLIYADFGRIDRPCGTVTEAFFSTQFTPLIPHLQKHIQNPANLVTEVAARGWIRGGIPSRQFVRDINC